MAAGKAEDLPERRRDTDYKRDSREGLPSLHIPEKEEVKKRRKVKKRNAKLGVSSQCQSKSK